MRGGFIIWPGKIRRTATDIINIIFRIMLMAYIFIPLCASILRDHFIRGCLDERGNFEGLVVCLNGQCVEIR